MVLTVSLFVFLITWGQLWRCLSGQKLLAVIGLNFALPILLAIYMVHFTAVSMGTPLSAHLLSRCLSTKNPIPPASGSRSVVLNLECTLEYPEGLL